MNTLMRVIDHEPHAWFFFEKGGVFFLDANCNHSAFGYSYMIELSPEETEKYKRGGREYLGKLAYDIHYSAPIVKGSNSIYKGRDVSKEYSEESMLAIKLWREANAGA
ncbi:MAG: hypothetical protein OEY19_05085 [Gammaproteobacteria bacterium]|nr:hypothetical protein [Gammaproteobacteria bacterium]